MLVVQHPACTSAVLFPFSGFPRLVNSIGIEPSKSGFAINFVTQSVEHRKLRINTPEQAVDP
jgi:hypothetical protein